MFFYLSSLVLTICGFWLWQQKQAGSRLPVCLFGFAAYQLAAGLFDAAIVLPVWAVVGIQLVLWGGLLWVLEWEWRMIGALLVGGLFLSLLPNSPGELVLSWGMITAVPLLLLNHRKESQRINLPIIAPNIRQVSLKAVQASGPINNDMIESQMPLLECLSSGVLFSGSSGAIEYANQAAAIIVGEELDALTGKPVTAVLTRLPMLGQDVESNYFEMNGRIILGRMQIVYGRSGEALGTIAILQDVTSEHQAKQTRDNFMTTISHELRTPLTAIKGYVELLNSGVAGSLSPSQGTIMGTIERNVKRMVQLINSLLFATSVRGGQLEHGAGETDLSAVVTQVVREMTPRGAATEQTIEADIPDDMPLIQADPIHVMTILEELVLNGINYNRDGGVVRITAYLDNDLQHQKQFVVISIRDEGIGIPLPEQAHIFDEFYRMDQHEKQVRAGGLGLGLPIVRALVEAYNGRILFDSVPNEGSVFTFILPTTRQSASESSALVSEAVF